MQDLCCPYYWKLVEISVLAFGVNVLVLVGNVLAIRRLKDERSR